MNHFYQPEAIEPKWQQFWEENQTFKVGNPGDADFDTSKPKYYVLDMFPYPSGAGLHVGHPLSYTATDILARYKRQTGHNVLHPMGWDAFGLPAEQYAIATGTHPSVTTQANIKNFRAQLKKLGFSYDWSREVDTTDPEYYRWTQWIFGVLYNSWFDEEQQKGRPIEELPIPSGLSEAEARKFRDSKRLAYVSHVPVWWCAELGTVLANEEVIDGKSERGGFPCEKLPLKQWMLRITDYADRLLADLELVDWPDETKKQQQEWIGRSEGACVWFGLHPDIDVTVYSDSDRFRVRDDLGEMRVFTTRPDTLYGATFMVIAPEHELVEALTTAENQAKVQEYCNKAKAKSDLDRTALAKDKTGVFTGSTVTHPLTGKQIPVWVSDYVLGSYGYGAVMAVPGHDERDFDFAITFDLPIIQVIRCPEGGTYSREVERNGQPLTCYTGPGQAINSGFLDGYEGVEAIRAMIHHLEEHNQGEGQVNFRLRDWLFSRQRYWGEPFPLIENEAGDFEYIGDEQLPLELPDLADFKPTGTPEPMLAKAESWKQLEQGGASWQRELNTMPNWAGSCWYYLRYIDPKNHNRAWSEEAEQYWMPVDIYIGGREHAVLHLLYARFWHKVLFDRGFVSTEEPFGKLFHQGMITAYAWKNVETGALVPSDEVSDIDGDQGIHQPTGAKVERTIAKMSKSLKNVENPDDIIEQYGSDAFRCYEMFMGPLEQSKPWDTKGLEGCQRFLRRFYRLAFDEHEGLRPNLMDQNLEPTKDVLKNIHRTVKKVTDDIERMAFNTAVSALMIFVNDMQAHLDQLDRASMEKAIILISPFAPHLAEELWSQLGFSESLSYATWPTYEQQYLVDDEWEMPVQVNGKLRAKVMVSQDAAKEELEALARQAAEKHLEGKNVVKVIVVPKRLVNIVVKG